jgi:hypothetical protein
MPELILVGFKICPGFCGYMKQPANHDILWISSRISTAFENTYFEFECWILNQRDRWAIFSRNRYIQCSMFVIALGCQIYIKVITCRSLVDMDKYDSLQVTLLNLACFIHVRNYACGPNLHQGNLETISGRHRWQTSSWRYLKNSRVSEFGIVHGCRIYIKEIAGRSLADKDGSLNIF